MCALIYAIIYPGMELILSLLQTPPELLELTKKYVGRCSRGIFFVFSIISTPIFCEPWEIL